MIDDIDSALVTGAGSGIGRALVGQLVGAGMSVTAVDVDREALRTVENELGVATACVDVVDRRAQEALADRLGAPDLVCLNAGIVSPHIGPVWSTPDDDWDRVLAVNLGGVRNGLAAFVPRLLASGAATGCSITASLAGSGDMAGSAAPTPRPNTLSIAVAEQTALSLIDTSISVTLLCPALVRSRYVAGRRGSGAGGRGGTRGLPAGTVRGDTHEWHAAVRERRKGSSPAFHLALPQPRTGRS